MFQIIKMIMLKKLRMLDKVLKLLIYLGKWVESLGLGESGKYIGKPDSIAIRIPDSSITCHLIDQTGPIAVTSANPTGEADTTHHWQVIAKLGDKNVSNQIL